jgi:transcriptional regulator with XRE-family HTH domain
VRKRSGVIQLDVERLLEALDRERLSRELTALQVADQLDINPSTIRQWRLGVGMSGDVALRLAIWLPCDLRDYARQDPLPVTQGEAALDMS